MNTQELIELEEIEKRLRELMFDVSNILVKAKLNSAIAYISVVLDEEFN